MPDYLILKLVGSDPRDAEVTAHVTVDSEDPEAALRQGFTGPGRYVALDWDKRVEGDLAPGPVEVQGLEDQTVRTEAVEPN